MAPAPPRADTAAHADAPDILPPPAKPPAGAATNILGMVKSCAANVRPHIRDAMPSLEALRASPHYPVIMTPDPSRDHITYNGGDDRCSALPINGGAFDWENDSFKGRMQIHLKGLPSTQAAMFDGKKRYSWGCTQGVFKRRIKVSDLCIGQEIEVPARGPSEYIIQWVVTQIAHTFSQTCKVDVFCEHPHFLNPLLAACQLVNVSKPGEEPEDVTATQEDCRLLHPALVNADGSPWAADKRRKWCDAPENVGDLYFEPGLVYTFCWWQHFFDLANYKVHAGPMAVDLCPFMCAQPIGVFIKDLGRDEAALSLLIWHERLLFPEEAGKRKKKSKAVKGDDTAAEDDQGAAGGLSERFKGLLANWRA